jgi:sugar transferase (PEP-CTERM/EpsH1 system associated)
MKILVLSTWFPYPVNQGSKIRAYHLIKALSKQHRIVLISYEDQPIKEEWLTHMKQFCEDIVIVHRKPFEYKRINTMLGFFSTKPSAVYAGYSKEMERTVIETAKKWLPDIVFALTFVTAPYALKVPNTKRIVDVDNLLAEMLKEDILFAKNTLQKFRRYLAYLKFRHYEDKIYSPFDRCLVVSDQDKTKFQSYTATNFDQIWNIPNGVDADFLKPAIKIKNKNQLIYNGALTYQPNFDAMVYFLSEIFPLIQKEIPESKLKITGKTDGVAVEQLPVNEKVMFTGYVDDIRPLVAASEICVVPLRQGAGTRLKILESMALGTAVVSTTKGAEGLDLQAGVHLLIADNPEAFSDATLKLLNDPQLRSDLEQQARKHIELKYDWKLIGDQFNIQVNQLMNNKGVEQS